ncbi:MAG: prepilin peptidase [Pirellulaceae bacterium]|nr:prepilin peptidase [Pirellulaceae bacterium]
MPSELALLLLAAGELREPWPPLWFMEWTPRVLLLAWLFWLGGSVGSFLNVVVYRVPRGMSLVHPGSCCPRCGHAIRLRDNIPILGWLLLGGKCRDCGGPISPRYVLVELVLATLFVAVAALEIWPRLGVLLIVSPELGRALLTPRDPVPFWSAYATHMLLATTLLGAALIDWDRQRTPKRLFAPLLLIGLSLPLIWPEIRRIPAWPGLVAQPAWLAGLIDGLLGLVVGALAGLIAGACLRLGSRGGWPRFGPVALLAAVGVVVGWQRVWFVGPGLVVLFLLGLALPQLLRVRVVVPVALVALVAVSPWLIEVDPDVRQVVALGLPDRRGLLAAIGIVTTLLWLLAGTSLPRWYLEPPGPAPRLVLPAEMLAPTSETNPPPDSLPPQPSP